MSSSDDMPIGCSLILLVVVILGVWLLYRVNIHDNTARTVVVTVTKLEINHRGYHNANSVFYVHTTNDEGQNKIYLAKDINIYEQFLEGHKYKVVAADSSSISYGDATYITNVVEEVKDEKQL